MKTKISLSKLGIIFIDHGSRRAASNELLESAVTYFQETTKFQIVEPAHMEIVKPTLAEAFEKCIAQGATRIVIFPYFLGPGRHWDEDIPRLSQAAAELFPGIPWTVTHPFGLHEKLLEVAAERIQAHLDQE